MAAFWKDKDPVVEEDWQVDRSVLECNKYMFEQQINCDVTFLFHSGTGAERTDISAHTYVLASRSPVFFAMFMGPAREQTNTIEIPDADVDSFREMLRFIYYEKESLTGDTVMTILYLAKKYNLKQLLRKCNEFLQKNLVANNVCSILQSALHLDEQELVTRCFNIIDTQTREVFKSEAFSVISHETLEKIVERDSLVGASEIEIFKGCITWAQRECKRKDKTICPESLRTLLGKVLYLIRFPVMPLDTFSNQVTTTDVLNKEETLSIFLYLTRKGDNKSVEFPVKKRQAQMKQTCKSMAELYVRETRSKKKLRGLTSAMSHNLRCTNCGRNTSSGNDYCKDCDYTVYYE